MVNAVTPCVAAGVPVKSGAVATESPFGRVLQATGA
eukprot:COSAG03_NODE_10340_length_656_cov_1.734291_2_plen_35_part_01